MIRKRFQGMVTTVESGGEKEDMEKEGVRGSPDTAAEEDFRVSEARSQDTRAEEVFRVAEAQGEKVDMVREEKKAGLGSGEAQGEKKHRRRPHRKLRLFQDDDEEDEDVGPVWAGLGVSEAGDRAIGAKMDAEVELCGAEQQKKLTVVEDQAGPSTAEGAGACVNEAKVCNEVEVIGKGGDDVDAEEVDEKEFRVLRRKRKKAVEDDVDKESALLGKKMKMEDCDGAETRKEDGFAETKVSKDVEIERNLREAEGCERKHNADGANLVRDSFKGDVNGNITLKCGDDDGGKRILKRQREGKLSRPALTRKEDGFVETKVSKDAEIERKLLKAEGSEMKQNADGADFVRDDDGGKRILKRQRDSKLSRPALTRKEDGFVETKVSKDAEIERKLRKPEGSEMKHNADGAGLVRNSCKGDVNGNRALVKFGDDDGGKRILKRQRESKPSRPALTMGAKNLDHKMPNGDSSEFLKERILLKSNPGDGLEGGLTKNNTSRIGVVPSDSYIQKNKTDASVGASHGVLRKNKPGAGFGSSHGVLRKTKPGAGVGSSHGVLRKNKPEAGVGSSHGVPRKNKPGTGVGISHGVLRKNKPGTGVGSSAGDDRGTMGTSILRKSKVGGITTQSGNNSVDQNNFRRDAKSDIQGKGTPTLVNLKSDSLAAFQEHRKMLKRSQRFKNDKIVSTERKITRPAIEEETKTINNSLPKERKSGESSSPKGTKARKRIERSEERKKLRERLRDALLAAGWKIDLRPRRDKNYDDNVYISPTGTSFWSLPKAWNALTASLEQKSVNEKGLSKNEVETTKQVVQGSLSGDSPPNMLASMVRNEDLSLLKRKRRKGMEDNEKGEDGTVTKKKRKRQNTYHESSSDENIDKFKEKLKRFKDSSPKLLDKSNVYDKNSKRRLYGDTERKYSTPKATSNGVKIGSSQGKKNRSRKGGCGLLVRSSAKWDKRTVEQGASPILKRTVLSWLIDVGVVPEKECVQYWNKKGTRIMLEGWIQRDGILCECCSKVISVSKFEDHAGATRHQPFENIYLQSGKSLTQCLLEAWDTLDEVRKCGKSFVEVDDDDQNDDTCGHCGDGGDLICCDKCPSTFHHDCLKLEDVPHGDWYCLNCTCGICGTVGHVGQNSTDQMPVVTCAQCEHEYHSKCLQDRGMQTLYFISTGSSFCGKSCEKIYTGLHQLLGSSNPLPDGFSWTLLKRFDDDQKMPSIQGSSLARMAECNAKLAVAHVVMDECFMPIVDQRTNIDMVSNVVFSCWSNFSRLNYKGFYTAVLEKDDELISVASIRIHGARLAEMPLIGTRHRYRRQGMCRLLVNAIEKMLSSLEVEKLILPAVPDLLQTWNLAFGFKPLEESHKDEIRHLNLMVFPGTDMLQKQICNGETLANETTGEGDDDA